MTRTFACFTAVALAVAAVAGPAAGAVSETDVNEAVAALAAFKAGDDNTPVSHICELTAQLHGQPKLMRQLESKLVGLIKGQADYEAKLQACQLLGRVGSDACIPALESLLGDPKMTHVACWALQPNPSDKALAAIRRGLEKSDGEAAICIMGVLGHRRDAQAVPMLAKRAEDKAPLVAEAAMAALGQVATTQAADVLDGLRKKAPKALRGPATDATLRCANRLADAGQTDRAVALFEAIYNDNVPIHYHRGALVALMRYAGAKAVPHVLAAIRGNDAMMKATAIANVPVLKGEGIVERLAAELPKQSADVQALLLGALAERGGPAVRKVLADALTTAEPQARVAAIEGLAKVGSADTVPLLAKTAATGKTAAEKQAALVSLSQLTGNGVAEAILSEMKQAPLALRANLIGVLHGRGATQAVPALLQEAACADADVQKAAFKAIGYLAGPDQLPAVVDRLVALKGPGGRPTAERAVVELAQKADPAGRADAVLAAFGKTSDVTVKGSLLRVLGNIGGAKALTTVTRALDDGQEGVRDAAIRALGSWPDASAVPALLDLAKKTDNRTYRVVAIRGSARLLAQGAGVPTADTVRSYGNLMAMADRPEDKKLVLAGLAGVPHPQALAMAADQLGDPQVRNEAALAVLKIGPAVLGTDTAAVTAAMKKLRAAAPNEDARKQAGQILARAKAIGDYLVAWQIAGPFTKRGAKHDALVNTVFPPEESGQADWVVCPVKTKGASPVLSLDKILGAGGNRVAYLRTWIHADKACDARLEAGSDDGMKAWLNGKSILVNRMPGACTPGEHKVDIRLNQGVNLLMLKIIQDSGPWEACARIVGRDGKPIDGVRADPYHSK